jgi:hypothetical protein
LKGPGYGERDAILVVASAIAAETFYVLKGGSPFNNEHFLYLLNRLRYQSFYELKHISGGRPRTHNAHYND